jgi:adenosine deaminase
MINPRLPLIDLHRHLDGNVRLETILDLGLRHGIDLPGNDVESLRPHVQVTDPQPGVMAFIAKFKWMVAVLVDYPACYRVAYENVLDAANEGLDYVELRFSPLFMAEPHGLDPIGVVEAVVCGTEAGSQKANIPANLIGILSRTYGEEIAWEELAALLTQADHLVALDLAGDEAAFPGARFSAHCRKAQETGLALTIHAGEAAGAESVWQAIRELGAVRIGHAIHAVEDDQLMDFIVANEIGIECNLTSNVQTSTVLNYASHPIKTFLEHGALATINTDDPGISGITLPYEYEVAAPAAGLTTGQIQTAQRNTLEVAFLTMAEKEALLVKKSSG